MQKISFTKMSGAGNDFIIFDKSIYPDLVLIDDVISKLCDRHKGIGADGIITISGSEEHDFVMEYYNADGSTGSLCGNGARCAISFASEKFSLEGKVRFISNGAEYSGEILKDGRVRFYFNEPKNYRENLKINTAGQMLNVDYINTGSPHVIVRINEISRDDQFTDIKEIPVVTLGREIRNLPEFEPGGTNVNFIDIEDGNLYIRTYERGVEDETLSCGTGSAASAVSAFFKNEVKPPVKLITAGGDILIVNFKFEDQKIKELSLTGPVLISFTGEFLLNKYL
ncbi:MAG TPA: diaminopimelate epimerase [Ignavibacteriaceae bacterium]|nr:diaminopimelate epimerase [Ignavibacteriaceae bacterium]